MRDGIVGADNPRVEHAFARSRRRRRSHQRPVTGRLRAVLDELDAELLTAEGLRAVGVPAGAARRAARALRFEVRAARRHPTRSAAA